VIDWLPPPRSPVESAAQGSGIYADAMLDNVALKDFWEIAHSSRYRDGSILGTAE